MLFCVPSRWVTRNTPRSKEFTAVTVLLVLLGFDDCENVIHHPVSLDTVFSQFWQTSPIASVALAPLFVFMPCPQQGGAA